VYAHGDITARSMAKIYLDMPPRLSIGAVVAKLHIIIINSYRTMYVPMK
jgi:hypothetical protein